MKTRTGPLVWLTAFVLSLSTGSALAQERLFIMRWAGELSEVDTTDTNLGAVRTATQLPEGTRAARLAGGRYLLLYSAYPWLPNRLAVFDTRTSTTTVLPYSFPSPVAFEADDFRPRLFYRTLEAIGVIEPPTFAPRELFAARTDSFVFTRYALFQYVEATNSVVLVRQVTFLTFLQADIVSIDAETGAVRGVIPADGVPQALLVDDVGRRLYVPVRHPSGLKIEIRVYDLDTLELLAKSGFYDLPFEATWRFDVMRRQILVGVPDYQQGPWALSLDTDLKPHARIDFSYLEFYGQSVHQFELMPSTSRARTFAVLARGAIAPSTLGQWRPGRGVLVAMDADRLQPMEHADLQVTGESYARDITEAILLAPPPPPAPLEFTVVGQHVELTWRNPGDATHFMVEAGTIAGRSNLGIIHVGNVTAWSVDNVPSGTYYVRVRAGNDVGPSLVSNEVVVTVP
jgi:hypothetical protein